GPLARGHLRGRGAIARSVLARLPVLAERRLELVLLLDLAGLVERRARRRLKGALRRDAVVRVVRRRLHRSPVRGRCFVELPGARCGLALPERLSRGAATSDERERQERTEPQSRPQSALRAPQGALSLSKGAIRNRPCRHRFIGL